MIKICISIFFARIFDVSLGILRTIYTVKGKELISSCIAFVETFIWFLVAKEALNNVVDSLWIPISYSLGYASGTFIGTYLSNHFIKGFVTIRIITKENNKLISLVKNAGYGVSIIPLRNLNEMINQEMLLIECTKKRLQALIKLIKKYDKKAFIIIDESKNVQNGHIK